MKTHQLWIRAALRIFATSIFTLSIFALSSTPAFAQSAAPSATLEELAGRLLGYGYSEPELIVGALPAKLPLELALPAGARIIGTRVGSGNNLEIVLDVKDTPEAIQTFFAAQLKGFESKGSASANKGGFVFSASQPERAYQSDQLYCRPDLSFSVTIYRLDAAIKDVRLRLNGYDCDINPPANLTLPKLTPPTGAEVRQLISGYGGEVASSVRLESALGAAEIYAHYIAQLQTAGWQTLETVTLKVGAVGSLELKDASGKTWRVLLIVTLEGTGNVRASLRAFGV